MKKQLHIEIPTPCHEKWEEMKPTEQGAYCKACQKNVIDFTRKTQNEIYDIMSSGKGEICGRFFANQIEEPIVKTEINPSLFNWRAIAASLAALAAGKEVYAFNSFEQKPAIENQKALTAVPLPQIDTAHIKTDTVVVNANVGAELTEDSTAYTANLNAVVITANKVPAKISYVTTGVSIVKECPLISIDTINKVPDEKEISIVVSMGKVQRRPNVKAFFHNLDRLIKMKRNRE